MIGIAYSSRSGTTIGIAYWSRSGIVTRIVYLSLTGSDSTWPNAMLKGDRTTTNATNSRVVCIEQRIGHNLTQPSKALNLGKFRR